MAKTQNELIEQIQFKILTYLDNTEISEISNQAPLVNLSKVCLLLKQCKEV